MTDLEITAYHEAGHAVVAVVLSADNVRASMVEDDCRGRVKWSWPHMNAPITRAVIATAGPAAAWRVMDMGHEDKDVIAGDDAGDLLDMVDRIDPDAEPVQVVGDVIRLTEEYLDENWNYVQRVAEALLRNRKLSAAEILELRNGELKCAAENAPALDAGPAVEVKRQSTGSRLPRKRRRMASRRLR